MTGTRATALDRVILVADDEDGGRYAMERILRDSGYVVFGAGELPSAISHARRNRIDLLVTDIRMPQ